MAFLVGDIVTMKVLGGALSSERVQAQPPIFGVVDAAADPAYTVLWHDGLLQGSIQSSSLDAIDNPAAATITALQGKLVRHTPTGNTVSDMSGFDGYVVMLYKRRNTGGTLSADLALVQTIEGFWREVLVSELTVVQ